MSSEAVISGSQSGCNAAKSHLAQCSLCHGTSGAFRKTTKGQWVHAFCVEWLLESTFRRGQYNAVDGMENLLKDKYACSICHHKVGTCLKCSTVDCQLTFHPACARDAGLYMNTKNFGSMLRHKAYCGKHSIEQRKAGYQQYGPVEVKSMKRMRGRTHRVCRVGHGIPKKGLYCLFDADFLQGRTHRVCRVGHGIPWGPGALCWAFSVGFVAGQTGQLSVDASPQNAKKIPDKMFGIFFEEINHAGAGGLWAELVNNRGFEAGGPNTPSNIDPWLVIGSESSIILGTDRTSCFERNPVALRMEVLCHSKGTNVCPSGGVGVYNPGYWGMNIERRKVYKVSLHIRSSDAVSLTVPWMTRSGSSYRGEERWRASIG